MIERGDLAGLGPGHRGSRGPGCPGATCPREGQPGHPAGITMAGGVIGAQGTRTGGASSLRPSAAPIFRVDGAVGVRYDAVKIRLDGDQGARASAADNVRKPGALTRSRTRRARPGPLMRRVVADGELGRVTGSKSVDVPERRRSGRSPRRTGSESGLDTKAPGVPESRVAGRWTRMGRRTGWWRRRWPWSAGSADPDADLLRDRVVGRSWRCRGRRAGRLGVHPA